MDPRRARRKLAGLIPGATVRLIGGAGHLVHYDAPVELDGPVTGLALEALASPQMALLSQMFRTVAITGRTDTINAWFADRQGSAGPSRRSAAPSRTSQQAPRRVARAAPPRPADPAKTLRELTVLHKRGVLTTAEFEQLRAGLDA